MSYTLNGKVGIVTGGGSGIGRATSRRFASLGAKVVVADRTAQAAETVASEIREAGGEAISLAVDVTSEDQVKDMVARTVKQWGRLNYTVNAAGVHGSQFGLQAKRISEWTEEVFDMMISVNLRGVWLCMKYQLLQMMEQGQGSIVNIASIGGMIGSRGSSGYVASKHGVIGLTRAAALEYAPHGIRINSVCPGVIRTPLGTSAMAGRSDGYEQAIPMARLGEPDEIASACTYLASDSASYVTGTECVVDGAYIAA